MAEDKAEEKKFEKKAGGAKPGWVKMKPAELEKVVVSLAKEGKTPAQIGLILRDKHGVPKAKLVGKEIVEILEVAGVAYESDKDIVGKSVEGLKKHIAENKHDYPASRALTKKLWALKRLGQEA